LCVFLGTVHANAHPIPIAGPFAGVGTEELIRSAVKDAYMYKRGTEKLIK
jgi:hypothetical protein